MVNRSAVTTPKRQRGKGDTLGNTETKYSSLAPKLLVMTQGFRRTPVSYQVGD